MPGYGATWRGQKSWNGVDVLGRDWLLAHAAELYTLDAPVVLAGDFNGVPTDFDIYPSKSYADNALVQPEPRAMFRRILDQGWIDAIRTMHPRCADVHILGLQKKPVGTRRRPPHRPSAAEP